MYLIETPWIFGKRKRENCFARNKMRSKNKEKYK